MRFRSTRSSLRHLLAAVLGVALLSSGARAGNWPRFRGENGSGTSETKGLPKSWSTGDYAWNVELPGEGHSSPIIWEDRVFLSSAVDEGALRHVICLDARTGEQLWIQSLGFNRSVKHAKSSWASATPATDGERVYVPFADKENYSVTAYDFDGNLVWQRSLGRYESQHGQGASPIICEKLVIVPNEQDGPSSIVALDPLTGQTVWSTLRSNNLVSYATPLVVQKPGVPTQLICSSGAMGVTSLNPADGRLNWMTGEIPGRTISSPIYADGLILQHSGGGGRGEYLVALDPFAVEQDGQPKVAYTRKKNLPYVPTVVAYHGLSFTWNDDGVVHCFETTTNENVWTKRVGGTYSGSPICVDGTLYIMSEDGNVITIAAAREFEQYGEMPLDDPSHSTPAFANGRLYLRTMHRLACLEIVP